MIDLMASSLVSIRTDLTFFIDPDAPAFDLTACLAAFTPSAAVDLACKMHGTASCLTALWHTFG